MSYIATVTALHVPRGPATHIVTRTWTRKSFRKAKVCAEAYIGNILEICVARTFDGEVFYRWQAAEALWAAAGQVRPNIDRRDA